MSKNQKLRSTITIGSVVEKSVKNNIGFIKSGLKSVGDSIKSVEVRQRELAKQRKVLEREGKSVAHLDREYEQLERTLGDLRRAQERWNRAAAAKNRVGKAYNDLANDVTRNSRRIAVGAALAGGAIFGLAKSTAEVGDETAKTADKLGIGIAELQELRYAAERSGVATSAFDNSLEKMQKNFGAALEGTGPTKDALDTLGLSAEDLVKKSPEEALALIADRMGTVETAAEKAIIANDIFGRSGVGLINMLRGGSEGLQQLREDARRTGYVLSEKAARDAEVFQDTLLDTQLVMKGLKNTVGAALLPVVTTTMRKIGDALVENREDVEVWAEGFAGGVERALPIIGEIATGVGTVTGYVWSGVEAVAAYSGGWENFGIILGAALASRTIYKVGKLGYQVFSLGRALFSVVKATPLVAGGIRAIGTALVANPIGLAVTAIATGGYLIYRNWEKLAPWFKDTWDDTKKVFGGFAEFVGGVFTGDMDKAKSGLQRSWTGLKGFWQRNFTAIGNVTKSVFLEHIKPHMDAMGVTGAITSAWETVKTALDRVLDAIGKKFEQAWKLIEPVVTGLKWVKDKGSEVLSNIGIGNAAGKQIGDAAKNSATTPGQSGLSADRQAEVTSWQAKRLEKLRQNGVNPQKRALGGAFRPGWLLTGERGPEMRFQNRAGYIADNRAMRQLADYAGKVGSVMGPHVARMGRYMATAKRVAGTSQVRTLDLPDTVQNLLSRVQAPAQAMQAAAPVHVTSNDTYHIHAEGADAQEVLRLLEQKQRRNANRRLYDAGAAAGGI